jgi:hypothetical protein
VIQDNKEQLRGSQSPRNFEIKLHTMPHHRVRKYELYLHPSQKWLGGEASRGGGDQTPVRASLGDVRSTTGGKGEAVAAIEREFGAGERNCLNGQPYPALIYSIAMPTR